MPKVVPPAINELMSAVKVAGHRPRERLVRLRAFDDATKMDFDVGVPVTDPVKPTGRIQAGQLPAARVARTIHHGPYEDCRRLAEFDAWIAKNGHNPAGHASGTFYSPAPRRVPISNEVAHADEPAASSG